MPEKNTSENFRDFLRQFYVEHGRKFLWREPEADGSFNAYKILVSEIMLQQTQVGRVEPYFQRFLDTFPTVSALARSDLAGVLSLWQGLGYNRRARFLRDAAAEIAERFNGEIPTTTQELITLPGIGKNTAGAVLAYAFNMPEIFIETNIRTVYIHTFFNDRSDAVEDKAIHELLVETIDRENPREFYRALMDYGSDLKRQGLSYNPRSKHYVKQSKFEGSPRELRGKVLRLLSAESMTTAAMLKELNDERLGSVLAGLKANNLIEEKAGQFFIAR